MARKADLLFLKLAVKNQLLDEEQARKVHELLDRAEKAGQATKARYICVERGMMDDKTARQLKRSVKEYLEAQAEQATTGKKFGNYVVEEKLGAGAMGIVYKARHVQLGRAVALKLLLPEFAQDDKYVERFNREARSAAQLNHPNVVQCFDAGSEGDMVYIAMEFVDGENVKDLVEKKGPLDEKRAVEITAQVAKALQHAADAGLLHRDVKPANIMITREGTAKLLDLGLAKKVDREDESDLTQAGRAIGTPYYMAPEQALDGQIDYRADLYALGATLYFMLVGEPPYKAPTPTGVLAKHVNDPIPSVRAKRAELSVGVEKVVTRMLAKKPEDRYQEHANLVADLNDLASGLMPEVKSERPSKTPTARTKRANRSGSDAERQGSGSKAPAAKQTSSFALAAGIVGVAAVVGAVIVFSGQKPQPGPQTANGNGGRKTPAKFSAFGDEKAEPNKDFVDPAVVAKPEKQEDVSALELAARRHLSDARRSGKTGWDLYALLDNVGRSYAGTKSGEEARAEATRIAAKLDADEKLVLDNATPEIERKAKAGDLLGAADAFMALGERLKGDAGRVARERGQAFEKQAEELVKVADNRAQGHAASGREDLAANVIRGTLDLRRGAARQAAEEQAVAFQKTYAERQAHAKDEKLASEMAQVRSLAQELRENVRTRKLAAAVETAHTTAAKLTTDQARARAKLLAAHMDELYGLEPLATKSLVALKGQRLRLEPRGGTGRPIEGILKGVGEHSLSMEVAANATTRVLFDDLDEIALAILIRRSKTVDEAKVAHLIATAKCYRGDEDAPAAAFAAKDDELAAIAKELGPCEVIYAKADEKREPRDPKGPAAGDVKPASGKDAPEASPAQLDSEREKLVYENRDKMFPGSSQTVWNGTSLSTFFDFGVGNKEFRGLWKLENGTAVSVPAGQGQGLSLRSTEGRAVFEPAFTSGHFRVKIEFVPQNGIAADSKLSIVVTDSKKSERFESAFGVPHNVGKGHKPVDGVEPEDLAQRLTRAKLHKMVIEFKDGQFRTELDDEAIGTLVAKDLGDLKLAIEWQKAPVNILAIEVSGMPNEAYLKKILTPEKKK